MNQTDREFTVSDAFSGKSMAEYSRTSRLYVFTTLVVKERFQDDYRESIVFVYVMWTLALCQRQQPPGLCGAFSTMTPSTHLDGCARVAVSVLANGCDNSLMQIAAKHKQTHRHTHSACKHNAWMRSLTRTLCRRERILRIVANIAVHSSAARHTHTRI